MANTASAARQARAALRRREVNRTLLQAARNAQKKVISLIHAGKKDEAAKHFPELQKRLDSLDATEEPPVEVANEQTPVVTHQASDPEAVKADLALIDALTN